jgi:aspartyl-tRNA(Asn)/glutamyl-tRNA(Gln) amidotransferase subunit B
MTSTDLKTMDAGSGLAILPENTYISPTTGKTYYPVIGLEIHAELRTNSKMFCSCRNNTDEEKPNVNICAICMGHPGTLPVINKEAVKHVIKVGTAIGADIADYTEWDRKNYFYPDIPKGYQISQYVFPLIKGGVINVDIGGAASGGGVSSGGASANLYPVEITRIHLEEDTASSSHTKGDFSLVDFNRAGVPLMELVTEPVIHSAKVAGAFARELQLLLRYLNAGHANMEKGEMRVEVNISVSETPGVFGTKVEVKNLNSFRSVERSIEFEIKRHVDVIEEGGKIVQETRGFDETTGKTFSQRAKENLNDYRYFPDPDLPKIFISEIPEFAGDLIKAEIPELPWEKRARYKKEYGMKDEDAEMFVQNDVFRNFFDSFVSAENSSNASAGPTHSPEKIKLGINYITSDIAGLVKNTSGTNIQISVPHFIEMIEMIDKGELSSRAAKDILMKYWGEKMADGTFVNNTKEEARSPKQIAEEEGLIQKNDPEALKKMIQEIIDGNAGVVAEYRSGKEASLQFLLGQVMKVSKGAVNPGVAKTTLVEMLK